MCDRKTPKMRPARGKPRFCSSDFIRLSTILLCAVLTYKKKENENNNLKYECWLRCVQKKKKLFRKWTSQCSRNEKTACATDTQILGPSEAWLAEAEVLNKPLRSSPSSARRRRYPASCSAGSAHCPVLLFCSLLAFAQSSETHLLRRNTYAIA